MDTAPSWLCNKTTPTTPILHPAALPVPELPGCRSRTPGGQPRVKTPGTVRLGEPQRTSPRRLVLATKVCVKETKQEVRVAGRPWPAAPCCRGDSGFAASAPPRSPPSRPRGGGPSPGGKGAGRRGTAKPGRREQLGWARRSRPFLSDPQGGGEYVCPGKGSPRPPLAGQRPCTARQLGANRASQGGFRRLSAPVLPLPAPRPGQRRHPRSSQPLSSWGLWNLSHLALPFRSAPLSHSHPIPGFSHFKTKGWGLGPPSGLPSVPTLGFSGPIPALTAPVTGLWTGGHPATTWGCDPAGAKDRVRGKTPKFAPRTPPPAGNNGARGEGTEPSAGNRVRPQGPRRNCFSLSFSLAPKPETASLKAGG